MRATKAQLDATQAKIEERTGRNLVAAIAIGLALGGALLVSLLIPGSPGSSSSSRACWSDSRCSSCRARCASRGTRRAADRLDGARGRGGADRVLLPRRGTLAGDARGRRHHHASIGSSSWCGRATATSVRAVAADVAAGAFVQLYITFMAGFYVVMTGVDGGQWWVLAGIIIVVSTDVGRLRDRPLVRTASDGPHDQPQEDLGGLRRGSGGSAARGRPARHLHAAAALVGRAPARSGARARRDRRRPAGVAHQARPRASRTSRPGCRATAGSSTASTRSCRRRRSSTCSS